MATFGPSYLGLVQWAVCQDAPDWLVAMAPAVTAACFRDAVVYPGNALALDTALTWIYQLEHQELPVGRLLISAARARHRLRSGWAAVPLSDADRRVVGRRVGFFQDWLAHDRPGDPWWDPVDFRPARSTAPPATLLAGWYDIFLPEQLADFVALRAAGRPAHLTIGPWTHTSPGAFGASLRDALAWFDEHAAAAVSPRGTRSSPGDRTVGAAPAGTDAHRTPGRGSGVRLFVMGAGRWIDLPDWPPPASVQRWHLHTGGHLDPAPPGRSEPDRFRYDPFDPTPAVGGATLDGRSSGRRDQRRREERRDVLVYTSRPLEGDMTVAGPLTADLYVRSSLARTDVFVRLCVVSRRGRSSNISDGIVRLGPGTDPVGQDGTRHLSVELWPTAVTFRRGERVRLQVCSGAHPLYARNAGSDEPLATATALRAADQQIYHDPDHPSAIALPVSPI